EIGPGFAATAVELIADTGGVHFHRGNANMALGHSIETVIYFRHAWVGVEPITFGKLDLQRIVFGVLRRKVFDAERFAILFDFLDQLQRNVMMMNIDGAGACPAFAGWRRGSTARRETG